MFNFRKGQRRHYGLLYRKIFIKVALLTLVPAAVVVVAIFVPYIENSIRTQRQNAEEFIAMSAGRIDRVITDISHQAFLLLSGNANLHKMRAGATSKLYRHHGQFLSSMDVMQNSNDYIQHIIYAQAYDDIIIDTTYGLVLIDDYPYRSAVDLAYRCPENGELIRVETKDGSRLAYILKLPLHAYAMSDSFFLALIDPAMMDDEAGPLGIAIPEARYYLINSRGETIYPKAIAADALPENFLSEAEAAYEGGTRALTLRNADGRQALFFIERLSTGTYLVAETTYDAMWKRSRWIWELALALAAGVSVVSILLTLYMSKQFYAPIDDVVRSVDQLNPPGPDGESETRARDDVRYIQSKLQAFRNDREMLKRSVDDMQEVIAKHYLRAILSGEVLYTPDARYDMAIEPLPKQAQHIVAVFHAESPEGQNGLGPNDRPLAVAAIRKIIAGVVSGVQHLHSEFLFRDLYGITLVLFFDQDEHEADIIKRTRNFAVQSVQAVSDALDIRLIVGIGTPYANLLDTALSYNEARVALRGHLYTQATCQVHVYDALQVRTPGESAYPVSIEQEMLNQLASRDIDALNQSLAEFIKHVQESGSFNFVNQSFTLLLSVLMRSVIAGKANAQQLLENHLFQEMENCRTGEAMQAWMSRRAFPLLLELSAPDHRRQSGRAIGDALNFIQNNVTADLSLVQCADHVNLSPSYLSSLIKRETGHTFSEHIARQKIAYVKRKLTLTDAPISEIAREIGYSERSLYRIFTKHEGQSPGAYRNTHRKDDSANA